MAHIRFGYWVLIACALFVIGIGAGILVSAVVPEDIVEFFSEEITTFGELGEIFSPFTLSTAIFIFFKNVFALIFSFVFSPILCLMPIIALVFNGSFISFISTLVIEEESIGFLVLGLLPHGIFEIPAFIIGEAAALCFGATTIYALFSRKGSNILLPAFKKNLKYLILAFVLLIPAAIIETYVTPLFLQ